MGNDYKKTMNLPKTDFSMRANLPENEPKRLAKWEEQDLYGQILAKNKDNEPFVLHDGPPYANGPIHIGHAFNKTLKDIIVKYHSQRGFYSPYVPGWDCHGLPIENKVEDMLGPEKMKNVDVPTFRKICREYATKQLDGQRAGFKRLGVNGEWDNPYLTYLPEYEAGNIEIFKKLYMDGAVYRGRKPIHWCKHCHTALAEAEIEYGDETSPSIYVRFKMNNVPEVFAQAGVNVEDAYVLIWTTTPWTLPANAAVCLGPDLQYCFVKADGAWYLMALGLVETVAKVAGWESYEVLSVQGEPVTMLGKEFGGTTYRCPIMDREGAFVWRNHVTLDAGTGCVHTAGGHGVDDYLVSMEFGVDIIMPVDDDGRFMDVVPHFAGMDTDEANPHIIAWLKEQGTLVAHVDLVHSYPHCWRCHQPVIFRATDQWFVSMDKTGLREGALDAINNQVNWVPAWASNRIGAMVADRPDWCISRQRFWGVPIPVFKCGSCGETVATEKTFDAVISLFRTEGADAWYVHEPKDYLPADTCCPACGASVEALIPEKDVLDVWWESGVSHTSVCEARANLCRPADVYLEGSDQHRGWFQSSLLTSVGAYGIPPYKNVVSCGFILDPQGRKMSKSLGNVVDPAEVVNKYGADVLRLWAASVDYGQDVSVGDEILQRTSEAYRRIRNTFRFLLGNLDGFNDETDMVSLEEMNPIDLWAMVRLSEIRDQVEAAYEEYSFHKVFRVVYDYINTDLSAVYMDVVKDRLYSEAPGSLARRSAQTAIMNILEVLVRVMSPILSFTCDEAWEHYPEAMRNRPGRPWSVQLAGWPEASDFVPALPAEEECASIKARFDTLLEVRSAVTKAIEEARNAKVFGKSQEAVAVIRSADAEVSQVLRSFAPEVLEEFFIVSQVRILDGEGELEVTVEKTELDRCPRCWNHRELGSNPAHPDLCGRCADVIDSLGL